MAATLEQNETKILYLPLKDETLPNLKPHTTLSQVEQSKIKEISASTFDVVTGITKLPYSPSFLSQIHRVLKPGGIIMIQIGKETELKKSLLYSGFTDIESKQQSQINHVRSFIHYINNSFTLSARILNHNPISSQISSGQRINQSKK